MPKLDVPAKKNIFYVISEYLFQLLSLNDGRFPFKQS